MTDVWIIAPDGVVRPGTYKARLVKGGPLVPIRLTMIIERDDLGELTGDEILIIEIDGVRVEKPWDHPPIIGEPITGSEYRYLLATREHDRKHGTSLADVRKPIDFLNAPVPI